MGTGVLIPIPNGVVAIVVLVGLVVLVIGGIKALIKYVSFRERETLTFASRSNHADVGSESSVTTLAGRSRHDQTIESVDLPRDQSANVFFSHLAPAAGLSAEINRTKNTLLFRNSTALDHRLVIAMTGSGRFATAYYSTRDPRLTSSPRLTLGVNANEFTLKSSPESLIFRDGDEAFYEISLQAINAVSDSSSLNLLISTNKEISEVSGASRSEFQRMAQLISRVAIERPNIIYLED